MYGYTEVLVAVVLAICSICAVWNLFWHYIFCLLYLFLIVTNFKQQLWLQRWAA